MCVCVCACVDNFWDSVLSIHLVSPGDWTQVGQLGASAFTAEPPCWPQFPSGSDVKLCFCLLLGKEWISFIRCYPTPAPCILSQTWENLHRALLAAILNHKSPVLKLNFTLFNNGIWEVSDGCVGGFCVLLAAFLLVLFLKGVWCHLAGGKDYLCHKGQDVCR